MKNISIYLLIALIGLLFSQCASETSNNTTETEIKTLDSISTTLDNSIENLNTKSSEVKSTVDDLLKEFD